MTILFQQKQLTLSKLEKPSVEIPIDILGGTIAEPTEEFSGTVVISELNGQQVSIVDAAGTAKATITDDDKYTISLAGFSVTETNATQSQKFVATMNGIAEKDVVLTFSTTPGSAVADNDYTIPTKTTYTIEAGKPSVEIPIDILGGTIAEPTEEFSGTVVISELNGQQVSIVDAAGTAKATITDDDKYTISLAGFSVTETNATQSQKFVATMNGIAEKDVVLTFSTTPGSAVADNDYTIPTKTTYTIEAGKPSVEIPIDILGGTIAEPTEEFSGTVVISELNGQQVSIVDAAGTAKATITDDDKYTISLAGFSVTETNATQSQKFVATMNGIAEKDVVLTFSTTPGSAVADNDYTIPTKTTYTIEAGKPSVEIPIDILGGTIAEATEEFSGTVVISELNGQQVSIVDAAGTAKATITDDDKYTISLAGFSVTETNATQSQKFVATMNGIAEKDVVLTFSTTPGSAVADNDYTIPTKTTYTIEAGKPSVEIPIDILGGTIAEPTEEFSGTVVISELNGQQVSIVDAAGTAKATITDDDKYTISLAGFTVTETNDNAIAEVCCYHERNC